MGDLNWFTNNADKSAAQSVANNLIGACGTSTAVTYAWQLLALMDDAFNGRRSGSAGDGATLANQMLTCIQNTACEGTTAIVAAANLSDGGLFRVVGRTATDASPAIARDFVPVHASDPDGPKALWGAEPPEPWRDVAALLPHDRALLYGAPGQQTADFTDEYDFNIYPTSALPFVPPVAMGVCFDEDQEIDGSLAPLVSHVDDGTDVFLQAGGEPSWCSDDASPSTLSARIRTGLGSLLASARQLIVADAVAAMQLTSPPVITGGMTGGGSWYSPHKVKTTQALGTDGPRLQWLHDPQVADVVMPNEILDGLELEAVTGVDGTAVQGVLVHLMVGNNSGAPAGAVFTDGPTLTGTTDRNGQIHICSTPPVDGIGCWVHDDGSLAAPRIAKTGGYYVVAHVENPDVEVTVLQFADLQSNDFHVRKK